MYTASAGKRLFETLVKGFADLSVVTVDQAVVSNEIFPPAGLFRTLSDGMLPSFKQYKPLTESNYLSGSLYLA